MSNDQSSNDDRDLLSRLNALKKSTIEFDDTKPVLAAQLAADQALHVNPVHALFSDLSTRFQGLKGAHNRGYTDDALKKDGMPLETPQLQNESNEKTVEELLAELESDDQWTLGKDEDLEIDALLNDAHSALKASTPNKDTSAAAATAADPQDTDAAETRPAHVPAESSIPAIDLEVFKPAPDTDTSTPASPSSQPKTLDQEADETLQRLLDEIALDPSPTTIAEQAGLELPSAGQGDLESDPSPSYFAGTPPSETVDDALARRFASLGVTNVDTDDGLGLPNVPTGIKSKTATAKAPSAEDEIDTWCIICLDDANLKCLGCDGDLYCTKCWMEGHTGEDAGYDEKRHKAVQYVKGGGVKKEVKKRRLVSA